MSAIDRLLHERFLAFAARHAADLDDWARAQTENIEARCEFHRRSLAQLLRHARVRIYVANPGFRVLEGDPDGPAILARRAELDPAEVAYREAEWRRLVDQPFAPKETA